MFVATCEIRQAIIGLWSVSVSVSHLLRARVVSHKYSQHYNSSADSSKHPRRSYKYGRRHCLYLASLIFASRWIGLKRLKPTASFILQHCPRLARHRFTGHADGLTCCNSIGLHSLSACNTPSVPANNLTRGLRICRPHKPGWKSEPVSNWTAKSLIRSGAKESE